MAYTHLMDTYYQKLCIYAKKLCHDSHLAEDIVQNIFISIWERRQKLEDNCSIKSYLYQCVYNEFISQYRKKSRHLSLKKEYAKTLNTVLNEDTNSLQELTDLVKKEVQNLPPRCKEIFILGKKEGLTYTEISEHLGISHKTVENQMSKAFALIRKSVGNKVNTILFLLFGVKLRQKLNVKV